MKQFIVEPFILGPGSFHLLIIFCYSERMSMTNPSLSIDSIYTNLVEIIKNKDQKPLDQIGSYILGATLVKDGIEDLFKEYPVLEEIADVGSNLEYQGEEYSIEYYERLKELIKKLGDEI
jgi:dihydroorotase